MNKRKLSVTVLVILFVSVCFLSDHCKAQPRTVGGQFSLNGIGLSYQHSVGDSTFVDVCAGIDFLELIDGQTNIPGGKAQVTYNFVFFRKNYESGDLFLYAGPGVMLGYVRNKGAFGPALGFCGRFGFEFKFNSRPVTFSLDLLPTLSVHMRDTGRGTSLDFFKKGLLYSLSPVLGLRYHF